MPHRSMPRAARMGSLSPAATQAVTKRSRELTAQGVDVINFGIGQPDFDTPEHIKEATVRAMAQGFTGYTNASGIDELKDAVRFRYKEDYGLEYSREETAICCGARHVFFNALLACLNPGEEVLIPSPCWVAYEAQVRLADCVPVFVPRSMDQGWRLDPEAVARALTPRTRMLVVNTPCNPTGCVHEADTLAALAEFCLEHRIWLLVDEVYDKFLYSGARHVNPPMLDPRYRECTLLMNAVSKTYAMTGWRIGSVLGPEAFMKDMFMVMARSTSNPTSIAQKAAVEALTGPQDFVRDMTREFALRRESMLQGLGRLPSLVFNEPRGAYYVMADVSKLLDGPCKARGMSGSAELCMHLLEQARVALFAGSAFGAEGFVRFSYATPGQRIEQGIDRLKKALDEL